jgi:hypothetical protein
MSSTLNPKWTLYNTQVAGIVSDMAYPRNETTPPVAQDIHHAQYRER